MSNLSIAYEDNILAIAITNTTSIAITFPLLCYGLVRFWQFRDHLFIEKRFPRISQVIILTTFISGIILNTIQWMYVSGVAMNPSGEATSIFVYGLVNLRLCLVYLRWKQHSSDSYLKMTQGKTMRGSKSIYYHWCSISILVFTCTSSGYSVIFGVNPMITGIAWTVQLAITVVLALIILRKHVNEGIGCLREATILLCFYIFAFVLIIVSSLSVTLAFVAQLVMNLCTPLPALLSVYIPLYYIKKLEGTINKPTISRSVIRINMDGPFFVFIEDRRNYDLFKEYLAHCWADENLLFYQNASILYQIVLKYKMNYGTTDEQQNTDGHVVGVGANKFEYLQSVYDHYGQKIGAGDQSAVQVNDVKDILYSIHQEIYDEFVSLGSVHQINIAHKTRKQLTSLLRDHPNPDWIRTFDDFLNLFDGAMRETYRLLVGMYAYEFKSWVNKKNIPRIDNSNPVIPVRD